MAERIELYNNLTELHLSHRKEIDTLLSRKSHRDFWIGFFVDAMFFTLGLIAPLLIAPLLKG